MSSTDAGPAGDGADPGRRRRAMLVAAFGTVVEWYDFTLYLYLAPTLAIVFFGGDTNSLIWTFGVFAAAYLMRPVGALVFGQIGDRVGRRQSLIASAVLMSIAMLLTAALPGASSIGWVAGALMLLLRCLMGFSVGGEFSGILVYLLERSRDHNRGYVTSWACANSEIGALLAVGASSVLSVTLSPADLQSWGWRVAFVLGGVLAAIMLVLRHGLDESPVFERLRRDGKLPHTPVLDVLRTQRTAVLIAFAITSLSAVTYYLNITFVSTYLTDFVHTPTATALGLSTLAAVVVLVVTPFAGALSDRMGRRSLTIALAVLAAISTPLLFALLGTGANGLVVTGALLLAAPAAAVTSIAASAIPEQFVAAGRFSAMAIGYNTATAVFGGLSPLVATILIEVSGWKLAAAFYVTVIALLVLPVLWVMPETAGVRLHDTAEDRDAATRT
ncbi:MFS transporter [Pseudonocardia spinosispora]|uniref:MFS transporter n=1 Tax=Pseudonocardia spinosispora TaxID=103441 RepID=UPI00068817C0|nr:MFS transporter [Pseudonocardia spinosispora]